MDARELYDFLSDFEVDDIDRSYTNLYNAVIDYENETRDWQFEDYFNDFVDDEIVAIRVKDWADEHDWGTISSFLKGIGNYSSVYKVDGYGWLEDISAGDLEYIRDEILDVLSNELDIEDEEDEEDYE